MLLDKKMLQAYAKKVLLGRPHCTILVLARVVMYGDVRQVLTKILSAQFFSNIKKTETRVLQREIRYISRYSLSSFLADYHHDHHPR